MNKFLNYALAISLAAGNTLWQLESWPTDPWWARVLSIVSTLVAWWWMLDAAKAITSRDKLVGVLKCCRYQFAFYAQQHRTKGTAESTLKAFTNDTYVLVIDDVLDKHA